MNIILTLLLAFSLHASTGSDDFDKIEIDSMKDEGLLDALSSGEENKIEEEKIEKPKPKKVIKKKKAKVKKPEVK